MQNNAKKSCQPTPRVLIDTFTLDLFNDRITAYAVINDQEQHTVFSINQGDFEKWADDNELREWNNDTYTGWSGWTEDNGTYDWDDIYNGSYEVTSNLMYDLLKKYIQFLYEQEAMDFQPALNKILSTHKAAI